jgi:hypothetical protein
MFGSLLCAEEAVDDADPKAAAKPEANAGTRDPSLNALEKTLDAGQQKPEGAVRRTRKPWFMDDELMARAGVGGEKAAEIRQTIVDTEAEMKALRMETGTATGSSMRELTEVLVSDEFTEERANELLDQILEQRSLLVRTQLEPKIRVRALLSASQVAALRAERPRFFLEPLTMPVAEAGPDAAENDVPPAEHAGAEKD